MNVALFPSAYHPHVGGVEQMCRQLAAEYRRRGMGVGVLTNRWPRSLPRHEGVDGVPVHRLAMRVAGGSAKSKLTAAATGWAVRRQMMALLRAFRPDVLHVHCVSVNAAYAVAAGAALRVPLVVTLHGELTMDATRLFEREPWARRVLRATLDAADAVTAVSGQTLAEAERWYGRPFGSRGRVVYNGIDPAGAAAAVPWPHPRPYFLAIGRHVPQKGFDVLLRAFATVARDAGWSRDLILAGDGAEHAGLRQLAADLGVGDRVAFPGRVDHATACRLFAGCDGFVLPSRLEPFGIVNLEAMAAGKAVVATRVGGVPEVVVDGATALLVPADDVGALAAAVRRVAADAPLRARLGAAGRARAAAFAWANVADEYLAAYRSAGGGA